MHYTLDNLPVLVTSYLWPFCRISGMFLAIPFLSNSAIPRRSRLALAVLLTVIVAPTIQSTPTIDALSISGVLLILAQLSIGMAMGFVFQLVLQVFIIGSQIIAMQAGLGFASMVSPSFGNVPLVGQLYLLLTTLIFLGLNGHLHAIEAVCHSFEYFPIEDGFMSTSQISSILMFFSWTLEQAVLISLPVIISLLLINLAFGVLTRAAPQINIFAIGFPITLLAGLFLIYLNLSNYIPFVDNAYRQGFNFVEQVLGG